MICLCFKEHRKQEEDGEKKGELFKFQASGKEPSSSSPYLHMMILRVTLSWKLIELIDRKGTGQETWCILKASFIPGI